MNQSITYTLDTAFSKCTQLSKHADESLSITCKLGLWSVIGSRQHEIKKEARRYFYQCFRNGEYANLLKEDEMNTNPEQQVPSRLAVKATRALQNENGRRLLASEEFMTQDEIALLIDRETGLGNLQKLLEISKRALKAMDASNCNSTPADELRELLAQLEK